MTSATGKDRQAIDSQGAVWTDAVLERLDSLSVPAVLTHQGGRVIASNPAWHQFADDFALPNIGHDESIADLLCDHLDRPGQDLLDTAGNQLLSASLLTDQFELTLRRDGSTASFRVRILPLLDQHGSIIGAIWSFQDVTAEQRSRDLQRHREKMLAISRLSAGIAHEFNNLLTAVLGNLEIMRARSREAANGHLDAAESAAVRATRLIQELRHFGTRSLPGLKPQPVGTVVEKSAQILGGMCQPGVNVACALEPGETLTASIDAELLQDVILRVGRNSMEAISGTGGTIRLTADLLRTADSNCSVRIRVMDDGPGLEAPADERAFEPFFTTRSPDSNAGLGLAIVYGLVEEMGGTVEIQSERCGGTTVTMLLPFAEITSSGVSQTARFSQVSPRHVGLVDNEAGVRAVGLGMLKLIGHEVTTFASGQQLLDGIADGLQLDVILLDRAMPVMSGRETFGRIRQSGCTTPVVICSGTSVELQSFCPQQETQPEGFLAKPFTLASLSAAIEQARQRS